MTSPTFGLLFPSSLICIASTCCSSAVNSGVAGAALALGIGGPLLLLEDAIVARPDVHCLCATQISVRDLTVGRISGGGGSSVSVLHGEFATLPGLSTAWATWLHDELHVYA